MAKILGVREVVHGTGQLPPFLQRAQSVSLMGVGHMEISFVNVVLPAVVTLAAAGLIGWVIYSTRGR
jgi:hypothetical protein